MKHFALIGAAGYVAPRHLKAIHENGHLLVAALDKNDSVGVLDSYFPDAHFFTEIERFDRHLHKLFRQGRAIDFLVVCSPNYLHDAHCRIGLRNGADVICEKPLVLNPWNIDALQKVEQETGCSIYNILQLRHHPIIRQLKQKVDQGSARHRYDIDLNYVTSRGRWYDVSWKGDEAKSGGLVTNIGIHFFDMLLWIFGDLQAIDLEQFSTDRAKGRLTLARAQVNWTLSIRSEDLPDKILSQKMRTYRSITVDGEEVEFSTGFTDLHTLSYASILNGEGFGTEVVRPCIELVSTLRQMGEKLQQ